MGPGGPSTWSQEPAIGPYTEVHEYAPPPPPPFKVNFSLSSYLPLVLPSGFPLYFCGIHKPFVFPHQNSIWNSLFSCVCCVPRPSHRTFFLGGGDHRGVPSAQTMKPLSVLFTLSSYYFLPPKPTCSRIRLSSIFSVCSYFTVKKKTAGKITALHVSIFTFLVSYLDGKRFKTESSQWFPRLYPLVILLLWLRMYII